MHEHKIVQVYITVGFLIILLGFWIYLVFSFSKQRLKILVGLTTIALAFIGLFFLGNKRIIDANRRCIEKPIVLSSYQGKSEAILVLDDDFTYSIYYKKLNIKKGRWDAFDDNCGTIMLDRKARLGFGEFELLTNIPDSIRKHCHRTHLPDNAPSLKK